MLIYSDGGGRTCVYIALDAILEQAANKRLVDVFSCVVYLCSRRQNFIKTLVSYSLIVRNSTLSFTLFYNVHDRTKRRKENLSMISL
jgi:protein tyrosine phosphatase